MSEFAKLLTRLRTQAGYVSARSFYKDHGGTRFFGCTYKQYLNVESGRSVPQPKLVEKIASGLRVATDEVHSQEFALAYLRAMLKNKSLVEFIVSALSRGSGTGVPPLRQALRKSFGERTVPLTRTQSELLMKSPKHYWCFTLLANDRGHWAVSDLSRLLGQKDGEALRRLKDLVKLGMLAKDKKGLFYCPKAGRVFMHPRDDLYVPKVIPTLKGHWKSMSDKFGEVLLQQHLFTRASEGALRGYFPYITQNVQGADVYSTQDKGPDTSFFLIEAIVRRVLPF